METDSGIYISETEIDDPPVSNSFSIMNELQEINEKKYTKIFRLLVNQDLESETQFDIYKFLWPTVMYPFRKYGSLLELVVLYQLLESEIKDRDIDVVYCGEIERRHFLLIKDLADSLDLEIIETDRFKTTYNQESKIASLIQHDLKDIAYTFFEQLYAIITRGCIDPAQTSNIAFVPFPGREESIEPVVEKTENPCDVITSSSVFSSKQSENIDNTEPVSSYSSIKLIIIEVIYLIGLYKELFISKNIESGLVETLDEEYGLEANRIASYAVKYATIGNVKNLLWCPITYRIIDVYDYNTIVVGAMGTRDMGILAAADDQDTESFIIPHTIFKDYENIPTSNTTIFSPSELGEKSVYGKRDEDKTPDFIHSGRPYFQTQILGKYNEIENNEVDKEYNRNVMIATQDYPDAVRKKFLEISLESLSDWGHNLDHPPHVVIKTHPSESTSYYHDMIDSMDINGIKIQVDDENLVSHIAHSDVIFSINSNVTIESMIVGTPCISINPWSPLLRPLLFIEDKYGPVPSINDKDELTEYMNKTSKDNILSMARTQKDFARSTYLTEGDPARKIASYITQSNQSK